MLKSYQAQVFYKRILKWIDLIFGYKQQGPSALEVHNLFHPLFYEGQVDVFSIQDPLQRNAAIGFINNFGQIPTKLFKKPHPQRKGPWNRVSIGNVCIWNIILKNKY